MRLMVHINGWPGVGKLTIARLIAAHLDARLLDNHALINPAEALIDRSDPAYWRLRREVRELVLKYVDELADSVSLVLTDAISDEEQDKVRFQDFRDLADRHHARLVSVLLECDWNENRRRITSPERDAYRKLTSVETLDRLRQRYRLLRPCDLDMIELDVTELSAEQAATQIIDQLPDGVMS